MILSGVKNPFLSADTNLDRNFRLAAVTNSWKSGSDRAAFTALLDYDAKFGGFAKLPLTVPLDRFDELSEDCLIYCIKSGTEQQHHNSRDHYNRLRRAVNSPDLAQAIRNAYRYLYGSRGKYQVVV
jgi:hypothetical protein